MKKQSYHRYLLLNEIEFLTQSQSHQNRAEKFLFENDIILEQYFGFNYNISIENIPFQVKFPTFPSKINLSLLKNLEWFRTLPRAWNSMFRVQSFSSQCFSV